MKLIVRLDGSNFTVWCELNEFFSEGYLKSIFGSIEHKFIINDQIRGGGWYMALCVFKIFKCFMGFCFETYNEF